MISKWSGLGQGVGAVVAVLVVVVLPYVHIGIINLLIWVPDKTPVDRETCTCSCFDTIFKGSYENPGDRVGYKHIYFNATSNTLKIWCVTIGFLVPFYESIKYMINIGRTSQIRYVWLALYLVNVYPHYYAWWSFFSYWNDDYYAIFYHHLFFSATEMVSTVLVVTMCDVAKQIQPWKLLTILSINAVHMAAASFDQFIAHVIKGQGRTFQRSRDVGLMIPDVLHIVAAMYTLFTIKRQHTLEGRALCAKNDYYIFVILCVSGLIAFWVLTCY